MRDWKNTGKHFHAALPLATQRVMYHPRWASPSRWLLHSRRSRDRQSLADKSVRYAARTSTSSPIGPMPDRTRKWRSCTWGGPLSSRLRAPRKAVVPAPTKNRTRPLWSGSARSAGCNRIDKRRFVSFCVLTKRGRSGRSCSAICYSG